MQTMRTSNGKHHVYQSPIKKHPTKGCHQSHLKENGSRHQKEYDHRHPEEEHLKDNTTQTWRGDGTSIPMKR